MAEYQSFSDSVLTFANSSGIISIPAGGTKVITLKVDLTNGTGSGKTMSFSLESASSVVTDASQVNGTYPITGNLMSTAVTTDLGQLTVATSTGPATSIDPADNLDVFNFTLAASDQNLEVRKIKITNTGSTDANDLTNLKLYDGATQIGSTVASMDSDKTVTFDLSGDPLLINKGGITKTMHVKADISGGTNRTFQMGLQEITDITVYDTQYGVFIKPDRLDSWKIHEHRASTISTGKLTVTRASDSPSGNIAKDATNNTLAKFNLKATGEDVKITAMSVDAYGGVNGNGLYQMKVIFDGAQKGTTIASSTTATDTSTGEANSFTFGNTFVVPADGQEHSLEIRSDVKKSAGTSYTGGETITIKLSSITAKGRTSSASVTASVAYGYQVTISTGTITAAKNNAYGNWSSTNPTGVRGATEVLVGSFVVTAGASEAAEITAIAAEWTTTTNDTVQNLKLYKGTKETGTQIGAVQANVTAATDYTFYPSPYIEVSAGEQFIVNAYADLLNNDEAGDSGIVTLEVITGTGKITGGSVNSAGSIAGQTAFVSGAGVLNAYKDSSSPVATLVTMGTTGVEFAKIKYTASTSPEDILVTKIVATTTLSDEAPTTTIKNIRITADGLDQTLTALSDAGVATFDLSGNPWVIAAGTEPILTVSADINSYNYASSGASVAIGVATTTYKGQMSGTPTDVVIPSETAGNAMVTYRTQPTVAKVDFTSPVLISGTRDLFRFSVTADAGHAVNLYSINLDVSMFDVSTTSGDLSIQDLTLYDISDGSQTALNDRGAYATGSSTTYNTTTTLTSIEFGTTNDLNAKVGNIKLFTGGDTATTSMDQIPAGKTVTYAVKAIVAGVDVTGDSINIRLANLGTTGDDLNAIVWGDGTDVSITSTKVKTLPTDTQSHTK